MLLSNEAELLAMEAEKYSGINPIVVDNNNLTIGLDSGFVDAVSSISGAISGLDNKLDISAFTGYSAALDSGLSNAFDTIHNDITELQGDDSYLSGSIDYLSGVVTTGLSAYSAGPNINITDYVISGKDWLDTIQEASAYAAQQNPTSSTEWNEAYETLTSNSGVWNSVTNIQEEVNYVSGAVDNKLDFSAFSDVSGTFLTAHQPISANEWNSSYETVQSNSASWASETFTGVDTDSTLTGNGKDTPLGVAEVQSLTSDNTINITSGNNEVILGVNGTWFNDAVNSAVTGAQGDAEVNTYVHNNSATINVVNTTVQSNSGNWNDTYNTYSNNSASYLTDASQFYPMNSNPSGYLTEETDWTNTIKEASANAYNEATALIPPAFDPTYMSGAIDNKLDTTSFSDVSGTFLTAHQSLDGYATTAWVDSQGYLTAHQPISANEWNNVYDTVNVYSGSWTGSETSPTASVDSNGSIDIVSSNNTVYFDVNGTWFNDAVNSAVTGTQGDAEVNAAVHNNSATWNTVTNKLDTTAFSTVSGDYLKESELGYNAVDEVSAINGSAIAQYGAEKQWLVHDDTLVHASNSAQYALGVNLNAVAQLLGVDETVLYSATPKVYGGTSSGETIQLSESISNFERLRFYLNVNKKTSSENITYYDVCEIDNFSGSVANFQYGPYPENNVTANWFILKARITDNICNVSAAYNNYTSVQNPNWSNKWFPGSLYKVVGINRKS